MEEGSCMREVEEKGHLSFEMPFYEFCLDFRMLLMVMGWML